MIDDIYPAYISRPVLNGDLLWAWAKRNGLSGGLEPSKMHVTVIYSKTPTNNGGLTLDNRKFVVALNNANPMTISSALGMPIKSETLLARHKELLEFGATHDYADGIYRPHVTLKYGPSDSEVRTLTHCAGFSGDIHLGPEQIEPLKIGWRP